MNAKDFEKIKQQKKILEKEAQKLRLAREKAQKEYEKAKSSLNSAKKENSNKGDYSNANYWEARYKKSGNSTYEWYVSFEEYKNEILQEIEDIGLKNYNLKVMVPGCGNSTICEDLFDIGLRNIVGVDISQSLVSQMTDRLSILKQDSITYLCADLKKMDQKYKEYFHLIIDKGTLDAITSQKEVAETDNELESSIQYLKEMVHCLVYTGNLLIISTIPNDLFKQVLDALNLHLGGKTALQFSESSCKQIKTKEGGVVYYYSLKKVLNMSRLSGGEALESITNLLNEASSYMNSIGEDIQESLDPINEKIFSQPEKISIKDYLQKTTENGAKNLPNIKILIDKKNSLLSSNGYVNFEVIYAMNKSDSEVFDESDCLCLVCSSSFNLDRDTSEMYIGKGFHETDFINNEKGLEFDHMAESYEMYLPNETPYECLEYVDPPKHVVELETGNEKVYKAKCIFPLPSYGGDFYVNFIREKSVDISNGDVPNKLKTQKIRIRLGKSENFSVHFPLIESHPNKPIRLAMPEASKNMKVFSKRKPGNILEKENQFSFIVEDFQNIGSLSIQASYKYSSSHSHPISLSRITSWRWIENLNSYSDMLFIEADLVQNSDVGTIVETVYGVLPLASITQKSMTLDCQRSYGYIQDKNTLSIHIPYKKNFEDQDLGMNIKRISYLDTPSESGKDRNAQKISDMQVFCKFCNNLIAVSNHPLDLSKLPSGLFENIMHDCLCCENFSTILSISDMKSIPGFIKYGHIFFSIHPMYLSSAQRETVLDDSTMKNPVDLSCKMASSINDLFIGNGAALATTRPPSSTLKKGVKHQPLAMIKNIKMCQSVLNIESCTMRCSRCLNYLGDARIANETENTDENLKEDDLSIDEDDNLLSLRDINEVSFLFHSVRILSSSIHPFIDLVNQFSIEQLVSRVCLHFNQIFGSNSFLLYVRDYDYKLKSKDAAVFRFAFKLTLLNKDYRISLYDGDHLTLRFDKAIKVSFSNGSFNFKGVETKIPLELDDFFQIINILKARELKLGAPFIPGQITSYLTNL